MAGRMVLSLLAGDTVEPGVTVPTRLVVRGSTAPPRSASAPNPVAGD
jgi:hypothetical protein